MTFYSIIETTQIRSIKLPNTLFIIGLGPKI